MKNTRLLFLTGTAFAVTMLSASSAEAFDFSFNADNSGAGIYSYDITLSAGETLNLGDPLLLTGLDGVTAINSSSNADLKFTNSFGGGVANFLTSDAATGEATFPNAIVLTSSTTLDTIGYSGSSSAGSFSGNVTTVPFEPEANLGIFIILGLSGLHHYRKKLKS